MSAVITLSVPVPVFTVTTSPRRIKAYFIKHLGFIDVLYKQYNINYYGNKQFENFFTFYAKVNVGAVLKHSTYLYSHWHAASLQQPIFS